MSEEIIYDDGTEMLPHHSDGIEIKQYFNAKQAVGTIKQ